MHLLPHWARQRIKDSKVRELSLRIAPPHDGLAHFDYGPAVRTGTRIRWEALEDFIDFCEADEELHEILETANLDRSGFKDLYMYLASLGLNQWMDDHFITLSTLAYPESLVYALQARRLRIEPAEVRTNLLRYWTKVAAQGRDPDAARVIPRRRPLAQFHARH